MDLTGFDTATSLLDLGTQLRQRVAHDVGIQVCVGIAPTKTLAKLANHAAKKYPATGGVVDLRDPERQKRLLNLVPVEDVWSGKGAPKSLMAISKKHKESKDKL